MNISVILLVTVVAMATFTSVEGWRRRRLRIRGRRILKKLCAPVCSVTCSYACPSCSPVCGYGCSRVCRGKREAVKPIDENSYIKPMPCDFNVYDTNVDGYIDHKELGSPNGETGEEGDVKEVFTIMDLDDNGKVDKDEFDVAPLIKDCDQDDNDGEDVDTDHE